jgi:Aromatic acid exporter family member 1
VSESLRRLRERGPESVGRAVRLSTAAVASYLVALGVVSDRRPVTAALTALLIVQVTLVGTLADTARRILSVLLGVGVAITVATFVGFTWWSLGALVAVAILLGQALRLGAHLMEVPISAMLILAAGGAGVQATDRVGETLIGAAVGVLINVLVPPSPRTRSAGAAVQDFADSIADLLDRVGRSLADHDATREQADAWLDEARAIANRVGDADRVLAEARESRRLNPRAVGTADPTPDLRTGLAALEHSAVALRAVFRSIADGAPAVVARAETAGAEAADADDSSDDLRQAFAVLMGDLARAARSFGALVRAHAESADQPHSAELEEALDAVREARARLTELLLVDPHEAVGSWQSHGSLLAGVERVLAELDLAEFARRSERHRREAAALRRPAAEAAERLRSSTRRVVTERPSLARARRRPVSRDDEHRS